MIVLLFEIRGGYKATTREIMEMQLKYMLQKAKITNLEFHCLFKR